VILILADFILTAKNTERVAEGRRENPGGFYEILMDLSQTKVMVSVGGYISTNKFIEMDSWFWVVFYSP